MDKRGKMAVCGYGRLGIVTGSRHRPDEGVTYFGLRVRDHGKWQSKDRAVRFLSKEEERWLRDRLGLAPMEEEGDG